MIVKSSYKYFDTPPFERLGGVSMSLLSNLSGLVTVASTTEHSRSDAE